MSENNQTLKQRREKAESLEAAGTTLYSNNFKPANAIRELLPKVTLWSRRRQNRNNPPILSPDVSWL